MDLVVLTGFLHVYEEMEKAQAAMVRLMIKAKEAAGPSGSQGSHCPRLVRIEDIYLPVISRSDNVT